MIEIEFDLRRSLAELDPDTWGADAGEHAEAVWRLARKPARKLSAAELKYLLSENISLPFVVPLALVCLEDAPLLAALAHPGDLLTALMESDSRFWAEREDLWAEGIGLAAQAVEQIQAGVAAEQETDYLPWRVGDDFMGALLHFRGIHE